MNIELSEKREKFNQIIKEKAKNVEIIGDAACREVCTGYVGEIVRLDTAALGNQLPPYHPNCACEFIAYEY